MASGNGHMPNDRLRCSQLLWMHAARLSAWAKHTHKASFYKRAEAEFIAKILESAAKLVDPDAIFEALDIGTEPPVDLSPWMAEVGIDDPTPVDYPRGARK
jgi:hypothetical protein